MQPETDSKPKNLLGGRPNMMATALVLLYLIVLPLGLWTVYSKQNAKLKDADKALAAEKAKTNEASFIDSNKYQAVFLDNGQVYFGKIKDLNPQFVTITDIYYLNTTDDLNKVKDDGSVSLVRLGCELHGPADKMVINRSSVTFWENLKDDGQVAKAISLHIKTTAGDSQKCE